MDALRYIDEGSSRPDRRIESRELVVGIRNDLAEIFFEDLRILFETGIGIKEDHALFNDFVQHLVIDDFRFILRRYTGKILGFRFRDTKAVKGILDGLRYFIPVTGDLFAWLYIIGKILKIHIGKIRSPLR